MSKPTFTPIDELQALAGQKRKMLHFFGFKSITQARKVFDGADGKIYDDLFSEYNRLVRQENSAAQLVYTQALKKWTEKEVAKLITAQTSAIAKKP